MEKFSFFLGVIFEIGAAMVGSSIVLILLGQPYAVYKLVTGLIVTALINNYSEKRA